MPDITFFCMTATPFREDGEIDDAAFRAMLGRLMDAKLSVYVGSGGSGEGHALRPAELRRLYEIAIEEYRGNGQVHANPPEQHTARMTIEHARLAADAGVDVVRIYTLAGWHGMKPTDPELIDYFASIFREIRHPVALAVNPTMGYTPKPSVVIDLCRRFPQILSVKLTNVPDTYQIEVGDALGPDTSFHVTVPTSMTGLTLGADGVFGSELNVVPKTYRGYLDAWLAHDVLAIRTAYANLRRCGQYLNRWGPSNRRWIKMAMRALDLPGHEGGLREPYAMPSADEMQRFTAGLLALGISEIDGQAHHAGVA